MVQRGDDLPQPEDVVHHRASDRQLVNAGTPQHLDVHGAGGVCFFDGIVPWCQHAAAAVAAAAAINLLHDAGTLATNLLTLRNPPENGTHPKAASVEKLRTSGLPLKP